MKRLLILAILLVLVLPGCGEDGNATTPSIPSMTPEEVIAEASPKLDGVHSFHFDLSQKGGGTRVAMDLDMTGASGDIMPPDRLKMKISAKWGTMFMESRLITVGNITYMENPINGKWELLSEDFRAVTLFNPETGIKAVMESVTDLVQLEPQTVDGAVSFHLQGLIYSQVLDAIAVGHAADDLPVKVDLWIGAEDFLLRKVVFDGRITEDENEGIVRTLTLSKFDEPVTIELPELE